MTSIDGLQMEQKNPNSQSVEKKHNYVQTENVDRMRHHEHKYYNEMNMSVPVITSPTIDVPFSDLPQIYYQQPNSTRSYYNWD